eukprot:3272706-Rhodomonas_salina.1
MLDRKGVLPRLRPSLRPSHPFESRCGAYAYPRRPGPSRRAHRPGDALCREDLEEAAALFDEQLDPTAQAINIRQGYYDCWLSFVSYAFLHDALDQALPASPHLVKAYLWNLLQCSYKPGTVTSHIYAILDRHRAHAAPFPFST